MTSDREQVIVAFDLYGTLLSTDSIAKELSLHFGAEKAPKIAALWRRYQLEYTWRLNSMKQYQPFSDITCNSLGHALKELEVPMDGFNIWGFMSAYAELSTFPDVEPALKKLSDVDWITPVVFSNGTEHMIDLSVHSSPDLSPFAATFKKLVSVEVVQCFKPDPAVYYHLAEQMGKGKDEMGSMWLVSSNPFDVVGANAVGMKTVWVKRAGSKWVDGLVQGEGGSPTVVVDSLVEIVESLMQMARPS